MIETIYIYLLTNLQVFRWNLVFLVSHGKPPWKPPIHAYAARLPSFFWKCVCMTNFLHRWQFLWKNVTNAPLSAWTKYLLSYHRTCLVLTINIFGFQRVKRQRSIWKNRMQGTEIKGNLMQTINFVNYQQT